MLPQEAFQEVQRSQENDMESYNFKAVGKDGKVVMSGAIRASSEKAAKSKASKMVMNMIYLSAGDFQVTITKWGVTDAEMRAAGVHRCPDGVMRPDSASFDCLACEAEGEAE
jgi:osmotically-inducible protein OsmY